MVMSSREKNAIPSHSGYECSVLKKLNERMQVLLLLTDGRVRLLIICMTVSCIVLTTLTV
jgi:hypothetical protein